jgi:drug/metabolite transporter (DMT)-like permease
MLIRVAPFLFVLLWSSSFIAAKAGLQHVSPLLFVAFRMAAATVSALGIWLLETPRADLTEGAIAAIAWNTIMVSLGGMGLYFLMLARGTAAKASANFYLVPGTAAFLAWLVLDERMTLP